MSKLAFLFLRSMRRGLNSISIHIAAIALVMVAAHTSAHAQANIPSYSASCGQIPAGSSQWQSFTVPPNLGNNQVFGNWFSIPVHSWNCTLTRTRATGGNTRNFNVIFSTGNNTGTTINVDGSSYRVYSISQSLGYIVRWQIGGCNQSLNWISIGNITRSCALPLASQIGQSSYATVHVNLQVRMVKRANIPSGTNSTTFPIATLRIESVNASPGTTAYHYPQAYVQYTGPSPTTCTVFAQPSSLNLGSVIPPQIPFVNSNANWQPFSFQVQCTAGTGTPRYYLESHPTPYSLTNNVLPNTASSAAYGVGIQILNSAGTLLPVFNQSTGLPNYTAGTGGTYTVGLQARITRTLNQVSPGNIWSQMRLRMVYQ